MTTPSETGTASRAAGAAGKPASQVEVSRLPQAKQTVLGLTGRRRKPTGGGKRSPTRRRSSTFAPPRRCSSSASRPWPSRSRSPRSRTRGTPRRARSPWRSSRLRRPGERDRRAQGRDPGLVSIRRRGAIAVNLLAKAGFKHVYNVVDGMEGDVVDDPDSVFVGQKMRNGWRNSGLPWTCKSLPSGWSCHGAERRNSPRGE